MADSSPHYGRLAKLSWIANLQEITGSSQIFFQENIDAGDLCEMIFAGDLCEMIFAV